VSAPQRFSREESLALLGPQVMADIAACVAAAPPPTAEKVERLRRLFAPYVRQIAEQEAADAAAERAA